MEHGEYKVPGGKLVIVDLVVREGRMRDVTISGDFFLEPAEALDALRRALEGAPADLDEAALAGRVRDAIPKGAELVGLTPEGIAIAARRALGGEAP